MNKGVTLIELLISMAIIILMASVAVPIYGNLQIDTQMEEKADEIVQILKIARQDSMSRVNGVSHGVKFFSNSITLFQGADYTTRLASYDWDVPIETPLGLSTNFSNDEIIFSTSLGEPNQTGEVYLSHPNADTKIITVNELGLIQKN